MKPIEITLSLGERRMMKRVARRIYNRLILESPRFNRNADQVQNSVLALGGIALIGLISWASSVGAQWVTGVLAARDDIPSWATMIIKYIDENAWVPALVISLLLVLFFMRSVSAAFFERSGDSIIWLRKIIGGSGEKTELLDIVENWMRRQPEKVLDAYELLFKKPLTRIAPRRLVDKINHQRDHAGATPALIIRNFAEKKYWWLYLTSGLNTPADHTYAGDPKYFRNARGFRNAIRVNLLFDMLGAELRDEIPAGNNWRRNHFTGVDNQYTSLYDPYDIPLRFRTSSPHYRWPSPSRPSSEREMAIYRVIMSLENPMAAPLHLIYVADVIAAFPEAVEELYGLRGADDDDELREQRDSRCVEALEVLQRKDVPMYGKRDPATLRTTAEGGTVPEPVLRDLNRGVTGDDGEALEPDWALRWDPNIIDWSEIVDPGGEIFRSLAILVRAIRIAGARAHVVSLRRGDVLVVDNLRSLVGRREWNNIHPWWKQVVNYPESWWMRGFYGFRKSERAPDLLGS